MKFLTFAQSLRTVGLLSLFALGVQHDVFAQDAGALQRELQLQLERQTVPIPLKKPPPQEITQNSPDDKKVLVKGFTFKGNTLLSNDQLQEIVKKWNNREMTFADLRSVTAAIQDAYGRNFRIARANIPPQEINDGVILIEIIEAKLGKVLIEPADKNLPLRADISKVREYFTQSADGDTLINTQPFERSLNLINELSGMRADGEFAQGGQPGTSDFQIQLADGPFFTGQAILSNNGSYSTGVAQGIVNLFFNNLSGDGDQATLDVVQSWGSTYSQLGYVTPLGHDGWKVGLQGNYLSYQTLADWNPVQSTGTSNTIGINSSYPLFRYRGDSANLKFALDYRQYKNQASNSVVSDYAITAFNASVNGTFADSVSSAINYNFTGTVGNLDINNSGQKIQDSNGPQTAGGYVKLSFNVSRNQTLEFLDSTIWLISASGQISSKNLNSSEQIYLGGPYAVRAYPVAQGGGSQGVVLINELQHRLNAQWQLGIFGDVGYIDQYVSTYSNWEGLTRADKTYFLSSVGLTARYIIQKLSVNAVLAYRVGENPLYNSSGQQLNTDNAYRSLQGWIRATYIF